MKKLNYLLLAVTVAAVAGLVALQGGSSLNLTSKAQAQVQASSRGLAFDKGIGFYYYTGGQLHWLGYPIGERDKIREECIEVSKNDFKLYSYGIDYSKSPMGLPPHLLNFCVVLYSAQYSINNPDFMSRDMSERQGPYAVHFLPLGGAIPTYEITCDLWPDLGKKVPAQGIWGFRVREGVEGTLRPLIYWFIFKDASGPVEDNVMSFGN